MKKVLKAFAFAAAVVVALVACKKEDQQKDVALTGIELNATTQALQVGQEFQLTVTYKPENATTKPEASWESDTPAVATVDAGKVTAVAAGTAKITAKVGNFTATCTVTVASAEEEIVPVEGNSAWSVIGALLGKSWDTDFVCAEENGAFVLKNVKLAKGNEIKFRKDKDWTVNRGINKENEAAELVAGTPTKAIQGGGNIIIPADGIYDLYYFEAKEAIVYVAKDAALPEIPDFTTPEPQDGLVMDGNAADWEGLNADYLVNLELPADAEKTGIKSAKAYYDDKLYLLVELSDDALADSKARLHVYFDVDNSGLLKQNGWANSTIDYVTEGKVHENGAFVAYGSPLYATLQESWACTDTGFSPAYESAGAGNLYELSMGFDGAPTALPIAFNIGVDVVYSDWSCNGFLPVADKLARIVKVGETDPGEGVAPAVVATWTEAEAAGAIHFFQYLAPGWSPIEGYANVEADSFENLTVADGVYTLNYTVAAPERWQSQFYMRPNPAKATLPLKAGQNYLVSLTFKANQTFSAFAKICQYNPELTANGEPKHEGATLHEWGETLLTADKEKTIAYVIEGVDCDNINFTLDFGTHPENTVVEISKVKVEPSDLPAGPVEDGPSDPVAEWDYTPSEQYLASTNLWKAIDDAKAVGYFYHYPAAGFTTVTANSYELITLKQSTYVLSCPQAATDGLWSNQLFMYPQEGHFIALDPAKTYKLKATLGSNKDFSGFFKMSRYNPDASNHEGDVIWETNYPVGFIFEGGNPVVIENEFTGVEAVNPILIFAFGGNPADCEVYIKDIILEEVGGETPPAGSVVKVTPDILPDGYVKVDGSYAESRVKTAEDIQFNIFTVANYGSGIQIRKEGGYVSNHTAFGKIESIKVTVFEGKGWYPTNLVLYAGTAENPSETVIEAQSDASSSTFNLNSGSYTHFTLKNTSTYAVYLDNIEVTYTGDAVTPEDPAPAGITIDGDFSDWAAVQGVSNGTHVSFKVASDDDYVYIYSHRGTSGRYGEIWGGGGYIYVGFNLDGDDTTGETLNGKGPYEYVFFISPYGGSADAPAIAEDFTTLGYGADCKPSTCSIANVFGKGSVTEDGAIVEFRIPRTDMPSIPASEITVYSEGNKDLAKVSIACTL